MSGKIMSAKFNSQCQETGKAIKKGEIMFYSFTDKKAYSQHSEKYKRENSREDVSGYIQANEDAYFDNFCQANNI